MRLTWLALVVLLVGMVSSVSLAQDDGAHSELTGRTTVILENDHVRVVRVTYRPHEQGEIGSRYHHAVSVFLTDGHLRTTQYNAWPALTSVLAGQAVWEVGGYKVENLSDQAFEAIRIELKDQ